MNPHMDMRAARKDGQAALRLGNDRRAQGWMKRRPQAAAAPAAAPPSPRRIVPQNALARRAVACCREMMEESSTSVLSGAPPFPQADRTLQPHARFCASAAWNQIARGDLQPPDIRQLDRSHAALPTRGGAHSRGGDSPRTGFYCELCRKQFATAATLETHIGTKKHKAKVRSLVRACRLELFGMNPAHRVTGSRAKQPVAESRFAESSCHPARCA